MEQGLGIGSNFPFFNRHQLTLTRFIPLKQVEEGIDKSAPPVLVLHGHYGGCVGDLASYDAFTLGGPYSVRGYNMGELGACRNILEVSMVYPCSLFIISSFHAAFVLQFPQNYVVDLHLAICIEYNAFFSSNVSLLLSCGFR